MSDHDDIDKLEQSLDELGEEYAALFAAYREAIETLSDASIHIAKEFKISADNAFVEKQIALKWPIMGKIESVIEKSAEVLGDGK